MTMGNQEDSSTHEHHSASKVWMTNKGVTNMIDDGSSSGTIKANGGGNGVNVKCPDGSDGAGGSTASSEGTHTSSVLWGTRVLVAIASYDYSQLPHLEEQLSSLRDICEAGAKVDVVVHTVIPYPVPLIDLWNHRYACTRGLDEFSIQLVVKSPSLRLNLVDCHRPLFYEKVDDYDVFLYTEDDIRVTPTTVAAYLAETKRLQHIVGVEESQNYNVGIVRYEYNYPPDVIINDKTRHATKNVTRVYWEHPWHPSIPQSVDAVPGSTLEHDFVYMTNHHQGMFFATQFLLRKWHSSNRPQCRFEEVRQRPGLKKNPGQPSEGTQRVWMSSNMMFGSKHCGVQQVIPIDNFGALTVHHLPNKNYRRVGKQGRLGGRGKDAPKNEFATADNMMEVFEEKNKPDASLLTALQLHVEMEQHFPPSQRLYGGDGTYRGVVTMVNEVDLQKGHFRGKELYQEILQSRFQSYEAYVARGGYMSAAQDQMDRVSQQEFIFEEWT
jgi:hypothetical protein